MTDRDATARLLPWPDLVDALRTAVVELADGHIRCPARQVEPLQGGGALLSMLATAPDCAIHKLIAVVPDNPARGLPTIAGQMSVVDGATGALRLVLDGATVTARRTAALSMLGISTLLGRPPRHVLLAGTGTQALYHAQALTALYPQALLGVAGRTAEAAVRFCASLDGIDARPALLARPEPDVDVVITCTTSREPVYTQPAQAGRLIIATGVFHPDAAEIGADTVRASRLYVDDRHGAAHEAGDLIRAGTDWGHVHAIAAAMGHNASADDEAVLFKTVGCAAWDLAAARVALARLEYDAVSAG